MEPLLVWALVGSAAVVLLRRSRAPGTVAVVAALAGGTAVGHALWTERAHGRQEALDWMRQRIPQEVAHDGYVSSDSCRACHPNEYASWHRSYHRTMTQTASAASARAPF